MEHVRWCIRLQQMSPPRKWWTNVDSHTSSTKTNFFSSCQRLTFPCVWAPAKHGTDVPVPPQLNQLPKGVTVRLHHEWIVVLANTQSQSSQTPLGWIKGKLWLPWTSARASTEDGWRLQVTCSGSESVQECIHMVEGVDVFHSQMPSDSVLDDCHDYSWN